MGGWGGWEVGKGRDDLRMSNGERKGKPRAFLLRSCRSYGGHARRYYEQGQRRRVEGKWVVCGVSWVGKGGGIVSPRFQAKTAVPSALPIPNSAFEGPCLSPVC